MQDSVTPSANAVAGDVIYFFDASSTWKSVVEVEAGSIEKMERAFAKVIEQTPEELAIAFANASRSGKSANEAHRLIEIACAYLSTTTFYLDSFSNKAGNIWFLVGYRLYDGNYIVRPHHCARNGQEAYVADILRNIVHHDVSIGDEQHPVRQVIRKGGGAIINPQAFSV